MSMYILLKQGSVSWLYFSLILVNWHRVKNADSGSLICFLSFRTCSQPPCYPLPCPCTFFSRAVPRYLLSSNFVRSAGYHAGSWRMLLSDGGASLLSVLFLRCDPQACDHHESQRPRPDSARGRPSLWISCISATCFTNSEVSERAK